MPKNLSAEQYFENNSIRKTFLTEVLQLGRMDSQGYKMPISGFPGDHKRMFTLEQDENGQWKRVSLMEKYGKDIFNAMKLTYQRHEVSNALYDMVEKGNLFFYDRGSDVPMQYQFIEAGKNGFGVTLVETKDERLATIQAQRTEEAKAEPEQFKQYQESLEKAANIEIFSRSSLESIQNSRQRAHNLLSPTAPAPLNFGSDGDYTAKPMQLQGGSRFSPKEMESIVLAASTTPDAADKSTHTNLVGLTPEEKLCQAMVAHMYDDVMSAGRPNSIGTFTPIFDRGREIAADLLPQDMAGESEQLKQTMMSALRSHIQACRDQAALTPVTLRLYEETEKMALMMDRHQLFDSFNEFRALKQEADAMGKVARICIDGEKAKKELLEAYNNGGFASEKQRLSIVSRIEAHRYVLSRDYQSQKQRESEPEFRAISAQLEQISKEDISQAEHLLRDGQLMAQRFQTATRRSQIQEIMDATQNSINFDRRIRDYGLLTAEGQQLLNIKDPYQMITAVNNLPDLSGKAADDLVADMQNKQATKMDTVTAEQFWKRMLAEMGPNQFDPALMEADFSRLIIQQVYDDGYRTTQPLLTALGYEKKKDLQVDSMKDAELMERIRDQIAQGNVFFYKRGGDVPHRISLDEDGAPTMSEELTMPAPLGLLVRFLHFITGGRAFHEEYERYYQDRYFLEPDTIVKGFARGENEIELYNIAVAKNKEKQDRENFLSKAKNEYWDMSAAHSRAHNVLSLDEPGTVTFAGNTPDYTGKAYAIPESVKGTFTKGELDALCLAGITSPAAAQAHMDAGVSSVKGTTAESTASILEGHVYHDILVWGRYDSDVFFPLLDAGRQVTADALDAYAKGKPEQMAKLLGGAIHSIVLNGRSDQGVKSNAALTSEMALRMVGMLEKDPALKANCGIDAETLEGYKQELNGIHLIGEAYDKAGAAYRKLAEFVKENRTLTEEDSHEIATDVLTYHYLNALQVTAYNQASQKNEIVGLNLINAMNGKVQIDQEGKRINPIAPGEGQVPVRDYYLSAEEKRDLDADIKKLYTEPLRPVKILGEATLEQIRGHVKLSAKVTELGQITNPMAVVKALAAQDNTEKINELVAEVNAARNHEEIRKEEALLKQLQKQADELNGVHKGVEPKPENQLENSQPVAPTMN